MFCFYRDFYLRPNDAGKTDLECIRRTDKSMRPTSFLIYHSKKSITGLIIVKKSSAGWFYHYLYLTNHFCCIMTLEINPFYRDSIVQSL
jgi:hypothetical protein